MFSHSIRDHMSAQLHALRAEGLYKEEREIVSPQGTRIAVSHDDVINLCANNYLGLAQHPAVRKAAADALEEWGYGLASVRFICGTQELHKRLEAKLSDFLGTEDTILFPSCFDANGGLFEALLNDQDAVISDELNHASIIDGIRLCKAKRYRYRNRDLSDLEAQLRQADSDGARFKLVTTDGVFSMDGYVAPLAAICDLAEMYGALIHFDDCHATGFLGATGMGTHEDQACVDRVDITSGTLGKALGGASGGYVSGRQEIIDILRQRARPYLFSNSIAPPAVAGALAALDLIKSTPDLIRRLHENTEYFRDGLSRLGFDLLPGGHPIIPIMVGDARKAGELADALLIEGVYVVAFSYPVVPKGTARIRTQMSAAFSKEDLEIALSCFHRAKARLGI